MSTEIVLATCHLKKYYRSVRAVEDISLSVKKGEVFGFLGPNGSGKTTTIGIILGLIYPTAGTVELFGQRITPQQTVPLRRVGTLMGAPSLMMAFSARQNLQMLTRLYPEISKERIDEVLEMVGLQPAANRLAQQFSTGMKQRLGLALALLSKPDMLILDEPTNGMDPAGMHEIRMLLRSLVSQGITIFLSSHLLHEMELICDRVAIVRQGRVVTEGIVKDLLSTSETTRIRTADPEKAAVLLHTLANGTGSIQRNGVYVDIQGMPTEQVVEHLVYNKLTPTEIIHMHKDLESVFLELTQETGERKQVL